MAPQPVRLRELTETDCTDERLIALHTDPEGYRLMNEEPATKLQAQAKLLEWYAALRTDGHSYWVIEQGRAPVGIGGVRRLVHDGTAYLNMYYRLAPAARGQGIGRQVARAATAYAFEHQPGTPIVARMMPANEPSIRTARGAGLRYTGTWQAPEESGPSLLHESPVVRTGPALRHETPDLIDLWCRVNDSGGPVGFEAGATPEAVRTAYDDHLAAGDRLVRLFEPTLESFGDPRQHGALLGFGFVATNAHPIIAHRVTLKRVMTDPEQRGAWLGRLLVAALHAQARELGAEIAEIGYRGGHGLGAFYTQCGYEETGRLAGGLKFSFGYRDDVTMACRLTPEPERPREGDE